MKYRFGFVANSSSSSYIVTINQERLNELQKEQIKEDLTHDNDIEIWNFEDDDGDFIFTVDEDSTDLIDNYLSSIDISRSQWRLDL